MRLKSIREKCVYRHVWLDDVRRIDPRNGLLAGPNIHLWFVEGVKRRQVVLLNESTHHRVELDAWNIRQFDESHPEMPAGAMGAFRMRSPVVLSGCNAFKSLEHFVLARTVRPKIFLPVSMYDYRVEWSVPSMTATDWYLTSRAAWERPV
jgi:hypothetical protein